MIKAFSVKALPAVAIAAFIATAVTFLPGFTPRVEASVPVALAKADRLDIKPPVRACSQQAWPNFDASCLKTAAGRTIQVTPVRVVTTDRH